MGRGKEYKGWEGGEGEGQEWGEESGYALR